MGTEILLPEPISKNIFEQYLRLIDKISQEVKAAKFDQHEQSSLLFDLSFLEDIINGIERSLQDISVDGSISNKDSISKTIYESLGSWILILASWDRNPQVIQAMSYNFLAQLYVVGHYTEDDHVDFIRYIKKMGSFFDESASFKISENEILYKEMQSAIELIERSKGDVTQYINQFVISMSSKSKRESPQEIDPFNLPDNMKAILIHVAKGILDRYNNDVFKFKNYLESLGSLQNIEVLRREVGLLNIGQFLEDLFLFDEESQVCIWDMHVTVSNDKNEFDAAELGFLIWSLAKALESIDDVEVELVNWGNGSKWFDFKIKIKSNAAKVDIKDVLKTSRQAIETAYTKKPTDELRKFEAEKDKLNAEAEKIKKETENIIDSESAQLLNELNIQNQILDLQKKEVEIEDKKADVRLKNLQAVGQLTELIKNGIIQNNSSVQVMINEILFVKKEPGQISYDNIEFIDINEKVEDKPTESTPEL